MRFANIINSIKNNIPTYDNTENSDKDYKDNEFVDSEIFEMFNNIIERLKDTDVKSVAVDYCYDYTNLKISVTNNINSKVYSLTCYDSEYVSYIRKFVMIYNRYIINNDNSTTKIMAIQRFYDLYI